MPGAGSAVMTSAEAGVAPVADAVTTAEAGSFTAVASPALDTETAAEALDCQVIGISTAAPVASLTTAVNW